MIKFKYDTTNKKREPDGVTTLEPSVAKQLSIVITTSLDIKEADQSFSQDLIRLGF
jgi:hypothetical protein